ncbi:hypothetical protein M8542_15510 [Amycolatopsis sp. OK19-0408]|uniref:Uncharacterized protein n=1 Tax=Amycolatopsis iheyensis TaxID=2945988 RepID=A0A9X2N8Y5_9PSEU|nr:hypothetical protein [Amycolatopsis iheyensis]MCR6484229.1 hypothetical protein [Amycolatopsis iheyensis]
MTTVQLSYPAPPEVLWNALPAGVAALGAQAPFYDPQRGVLSFMTGMTFTSWGQNVHVSVSHAPTGSALTVTTNLKFGLFDWGEGKRLANMFASAVGQAAGVTALA